MKLIPYNSTYEDFIEDFKLFINERESIKDKRLNNEQYPWTSDEIFNEHKFTNINRFDDKGTIFILDFIKDIKDDELKTFFYIVLYRFYWSGSEIFIHLTKNIEQDCSFIQTYKGKCSPAQNPYQIFYPGGRLLILEHIKASYNKLFDVFLSFNSISIIDATMILSNTMKELTNHRCAFRFVWCQICLDLAYVFPSYIDINSSVLWGPGTTYFKFDKNKVCVDLNLAPFIVEHAMCEFRKYCTFKTGEKSKNALRLNTKKYL